ELESEDTGVIEVSDETVEDNSRIDNEKAGNGSKILDEDVGGSDVDDVDTGVTAELKIEDSDLQSERELKIKVDTDLIVSEDVSIEPSIEPNIEHIVTATGESGDSIITTTTSEYCDKDEADVQKDSNFDDKASSSHVDDKASSTHVDDKASSSPVR
ncbi:hypothetical protein CCACVL1_27059, partial [Corchorus capsularis]